jgi:ornithine--oxo-acid transaminase
MPSGEPLPSPASDDLAGLLAGRRGEEMALNDRHLNPKFGRVLRTIDFDRSWVAAEGAELIDAKGERYLDLLGGYGVFSLGRNNPHVRDALTVALAAGTANLPQMGVTLPAGLLAEELLARMPARIDAAVLSNSGAEAIEAALKLARMATGRPRVLFCERGFHGLTMGALSVNGNPEYRERAGPLLPGCDPVPFGDLDALSRELARGDVAAFLVEPVQGKGVHIAPSGYLQGAQELCRRHGTLLAVDEIQTGLGRTGRMFAFEHWDLEPDIVTVAKALSGGYIPIGATLTSRAVFEKVFDTMERAVVHSSTFAGNDLAAVAGLAALQELDRAGLVERAHRLGERLLELTRPLVERHELVHEVRGLGLIWALELQAPAGAASRRLWDAVEARQPGLFAQLVTVPLFREHRILTQVAGHHVNIVKILPPLVVEEQDLERFAGALDEVLGRATAHLPRALARLGLGMARRSIG